MVTVGVASHDPFWLAHPWRQAKVARYAAWSKPIDPDAKGFIVRPVFKKNRTGAASLTRPATRRRCINGGKQGEEKHRDQHTDEE
jgi:hypothetical protein